MKRACLLLGMLGALACDSERPAYCVATGLLPLLLLDWPPPEVRYEFEVSDRMRYLPLELVARERCSAIHGSFYWGEHWSVPMRCWTTKCERVAVSGVGHYLHCGEGDMLFEVDPRSRMMGTPIPW